MTRVDLIILRGSGSRTSRESSSSGSPGLVLSLEKGTELWCGDTLCRLNKPVSQGAFLRFKLFEHRLSEAV